MTDFQLWPASPSATHLSSAVRWDHGLLVGVVQCLGVDSVSILFEWLCLLHTQPETWLPLTEGV